MAGMIEFSIDPDAYRYWSLWGEGERAFSIMTVREGAKLLPGEKLKLNSCGPRADIHFRMPHQSNHTHKVDVCKLANETHDVIKGIRPNSGRTGLGTTDGTTTGGG